MPDNIWFYTINDGEESAKAYSTKGEAIDAAKQEIYEELGDDCIGYPFQVYQKGEYIEIDEDDLR